MKLSIRYAKLAVTAGMLALVLGMIFTAQPVTQAATDDAAATFTAKCKACHGAKAEKLFDATKPDADLVKAILEGMTSPEGKKMPAFKSFSEDAAKALVAHMKSLKTS